MVILIMPIVHEHRVGWIFTIFNLVINHLPLFVVFTTRFTPRVESRVEMTPDDFLLETFVNIFELVLILNSLFCYISSQVGRSVGVAGIFMVKAIHIMIVNCHEISHRMLVGAIVLLRIERGNIVKSKLLLYVISMIWLLSSNAFISNGLPPCFTTLSESRMSCCY